MKPWTGYSGRDSRGSGARVGPLVHWSTADSRKLGFIDQSNILPVFYLTTVLVQNQVESKVLTSDLVLQSYSCDKSELRLQITNFCLNSFFLLLFFTNMNPSAVFIWPSPHDWGPVSRHPNIGSLVKAHFINHRSTLGLEILTSLKVNILSGLNL